MMLTGGEARGYPMTYRAEVEYVPFGDDRGEVRVRVTVDDVHHRSYGQEVYRASHPIVWESDNMSGASMRP